MLACALFQPDPRWRVVVLAIIVGALAVGWAIMAWREPSPAQRRRMRLEDDARHPLRQWAQAAFFVVTGDIDYGHLPRGEARQMLVHWWEVHGPYELRGTLADLEDAGRPDNAWDLLRFMVVARLGVAAQYHADEDAWRRIHPVARRLQASYRSWPEMAQAYVVARRQWKGIAPDGSEDDDGMRRILDHVAALRDGAWRTTAWTMELCDPDEVEA